MKFLLCLFLCVCVLQRCYVDSGIIEKIKTGVSAAKQSVHCGLHKVKSTFVDHEHRTDPCACDKSVDKSNESKPPTEENGGGNNGEEEGTTFEIDARGQEITSTSKDGIVRGRLFSVGLNCPSGSVTDGKGNCFELF